MQPDPPRSARQTKDQRHLQEAPLASMLTSTNIAMAPISLCSCLCTRAKSVSSNTAGPQRGAVFRSALVRERMQRCTQFAERSLAYERLAVFPQAPAVGPPQLPRPLGSSHARWPPFWLLCHTAPAQAAALHAEPAPAVAAVSGAQGKGALGGDGPCKSFLTKQQQPLSRGKELGRQG